MKPIKNIQLSPHFTLAELTRSERASKLGIDNQPSTEHLANLKLLAAELEIVRILLGNKPITITSGYRSKALNDATPDASATSAHSHGLAADFVCPAFGSPTQIVAALQKKNRPCDQIIDEKKGSRHWVHFSPKRRDGTQRNQYLSMRVVNGKVKYSPFPTKTNK